MNYKIIILLLLCFNCENQKENEVQSSNESSKPSEIVEVPKLNLDAVLNLH